MENIINDVKDWDTQVFWQIGKPLHEQSEECLEFIWEIIK